MIGFFSLFSGILPFNLDIDQTFIAAILTIIGYAINDVVVIFDRIRENLGLHPNDEFKSTVNKSLNALSVALCLGITIGTYASIMIGTPIMYDTTMRLRKKLAAAAGKTSKK